MLHPVLLFVPLDDRPVCLDLVVQLARAAGVDIRTPERSVLGTRATPGDAGAIWRWLDEQVASVGAAALIASVEMLCVGGLVASRRSQASFEEIAPLLQRLTDTAARIPTYVSAVIPRTPVQPTDEDALHWRRPDVEAFWSHRDRHRRANEALITAAARGALRYLLIGQDDTAPESPSSAERDALQRHAEDLGASSVLLTSGADELNARLLARWLSDLTGLSPAVRVVYTYPHAVEEIPRYEAAPLRQTVEEHIRGAGCHLAVEAVDILLWVHNFEGPQREARDQGTPPPVAPRHLASPPLAAVDDVLTEVGRVARQEQVVALADVRFANGADRALASHLLAEPRFGGIVAYAGWNTCSNTLGSTLAQGVVAYHMRTTTLPGNDPIYRHALVTRLLDDWGYQAVVRPGLSTHLAERGGSPTDLGPHEPEAAARALDALRAEALPHIQASYRYHPMALQGVSFPWHRLFEVRVDFEITRFSLAGGRGIEVVDYDQRWPQMFADDRAAIRRALGPRLRGIEHVGSTAVPGLAAKPIIDIMVGVEVGDLDAIIEPLRAIGYEYNPDWEISLPLRRYFRRLLPDGTGGTHHLHAVPYGGEFWMRHLRFRDYLRAHPETAREYGALKKAIAAEHRNSIDYTFSKSEFIRAVEARAGVEHRRPQARTP